MRKYRYFWGMMKSQEQWLNKMAKEGWRLIQTGKLSYDFEPCEPGAYVYRLEFVAQKSWNESKKYQIFLEEMGYKVWTKNINLNWSMGKIRWRPYGEGAGQISTNPGSYNKELLIVEKEDDGQPFELHTANADKAKYYGYMRNVWLGEAGTFLLLSVVFGILAKNTVVGSICLILAVVMAVVVLIFQKQIKKYNDDSKIEE
ncbi:MAG: DUF2812 domain-containing protein [Lachnospiraceae bacterium]|nr:DUF2812 domain-containing protein [Lachnospiraceae bacterium]